MSPKRQKSVLESIFEENISDASLEPKSEAYQAKDEVTEHISSDLKAQAESEDIPSGLTSTEISISAVKAKSSKKRNNKSQKEEIQKNNLTESEELILVKRKYSEQSLEITSLHEKISALEKSFAQFLPMNPKPPAEDEVYVSNYRSNLYEDDDRDAVDYSDYPDSPRFIPADDEEFDDSDFILDPPAELRGGPPVSNSKSTMTNIIIYIMMSSFLITYSDFLQPGIR